MRILSYILLIAFTMAAGAELHYVLTKPLVPPPVTQPVTPQVLRVQWVMFWAQKVEADEAGNQTPLAGIRFTPLALQISRAENRGAVPGAWSPTGCCVGVMQVHVRLHYGEYDSECGGSDLLTVRDNACYGVMILRDNLRECAAAGLRNGSLVVCAVQKYGGASTPEARQAYLTHVRMFGSAVPAPTVIAMQVTAPPLLMH